MARGGSSPTPQPESFAVFVDTSLDTHVAMLVSPDDTVADLKGKIKVEHILCFPNIGEINVQSVKVRRKGAFYHLSDSMLVKSAFRGTKGTWFLYTDVVSAFHQARMGENATEQNVAPLQTHYLLEEPIAITMGSSATRLKSLILTGSSDGNNFIPKDSSYVPEKLALLDSGTPLLSINHELTLQNAESLDDQFAPDNSVKDLRDGCAMPQPDHTNTSDPDVTESGQPTGEEGVPVRLHVQPEIDQASGQGKKDGEEESHGYVGVESNDGFRSAKNEEPRKMMNAFQNDKLLEKVSPSRNKRKRKKDKDGHSDNLVEDHVANIASFNNIKDISPLENFHPETISQVKHISEPAIDVSSQTLDNDLSKDLSKDEKKKRKKRKKSSHEFDNNTASIIPGSGPFDITFDKSDAGVSLAKQVTEGNPDQTLRNNNITVAKELNDTLLIDKATRNGTDGSFVEPPRRRPLSTNLNGEISSKASLPNHQSSNDCPIQELCNGAEPEGPVDDKHINLGKESQDVVTVQGASLQENCEVDLEGPTDSHRMKKKSKGGTKNTSSKHNSVRSSEGCAYTENIEEASGNKKKKMKKPSDIMTANEKAPCDTRSRGSHRSSRRKSEDDELGNPQTDVCVAVQSSGDQIIDEVLKDISGGHYKDHKEMDSTVNAEAMNIGVLAEEYTANPSNPKERTSNHRRKKSAKAELPDHSSIDKEPGNFLVKEVVEEHPKGIMDSHKEKDKECKGSVYEEAEAHGNSSVENTTVTANTIDTKPRRRRKKIAKDELPNHDSIENKPVTTEASEKNPREILEKEQGKESYPATVLGETVPIENSVDENLRNLREAKSRSPRRRKSKKGEPEDLEKAPEITDINPDKEYSKRMKSDGTDQNIIHGRDHNVNSTELMTDKQSNMHEIADFSAEKVSEHNTKGLLRKINENSVKETNRIATDGKPSVSTEAKDYMGLPKPDSDMVNAIESFVQKPSPSGPHTTSQDLSLMETGARIKDKPKRKRKDVQSKDSLASLPGQSSVDEQNMFKKPFTKKQNMSKKPQESDPSSKVLIDPVVYTLGKEPKTRKTDEDKSLGGNRSDIRLGDNSSESGTVRGLYDRKRFEKEPQVYSSNTSDHIMTLKDNQSRSQSVPCNEDKYIMNAAQPTKILDTLNGNIYRDKPVTLNLSNACTDVSKDGMTDLAASSDSTQEETTSRKYRVAVRKAPSSRYENMLSDSYPEKTSPAPTCTIFNDVVSASSEDDFEIYDRRASVREVSDTSSTSAGSDDDLEERKRLTNLKPRAYMKFQEVESAMHGKTDEANDGVILTQTPRMVKKSTNISDILRSTSRFQKAKFTASQSQVEDSESQPVDVVLETQPESTS